ncbi:hypothetical protein FRC18_011513 [Serendipita sp. 400]|nr:hypothetical protein FRC18_011513 [Serendipita sp. 400]
MSVDLSDGNIQNAYANIVRGEALNWLILSYGQTRDTLTLLSTGTGGIEELQRTLSEDDAYFAFVREEKAFCLINFFPVGIPGVRRARALVHARAVTSLFKAANVTLTVSSAQQVEISAIRAKLGLERLPLYEKAPRAANGLPVNRASHSSVVESSTPRAQSPASTGNSRGSRLPVYSATRASDNPPTPSKSFLLSRKAPVQDKRDAPLPPPPPAGDDSEDYEIVNAPIITANAIAARLRGPSMAISDIQSQYSVDTHQVPDLPQSYAASSYRQSSEIDFTGGGTPSSKPLFLTEAQEQAALSRAKWAEEEESGSSSRRNRRGRTKSDIQREREQEELEMARAAAEAAARRKYEKEQEMLKEAEEEERKKAEFAEAQRRRAGERLRREQLRREEEEREQRAAEERKRAVAERRLEEARRAEARRLEEIKYQEEKERKEREKKEAQEAERLGRMRDIQRRFDNLRLTAGVLLTGYVSIQPGTSIVWRRRFFQLQSDHMLFFKNAEETHKIVDSFELQGEVTGVKEWNQGYDDLRAIPHSFAVEFIDQPSWLFFADSEEDKDILVSLIVQLARI